MLNNNKKEKFADHGDVYKERKTPRYATNAGITIEGFDGEARVRNIGLTGCCMESVTYASLVPDDTYNVRIIPEKKSGIEPFSLRLILDWTKSSETLYEAGFELDKDQVSAKLKQYVEYLHSSGVEPDYGSTDKPTG